MTNAWLVQCRVGLPARTARGFTLAETILVMGMLAIAAAVLMRMQPRIFSAQTALRDEVVGIELQRACAERLLAVRRQQGYKAVTSTTCNGLGVGLDAFSSNPSVTLSTNVTAPVTACADTTCTALITVPKTSGAAAALPALTVRFSDY